MIWYQLGLIAYYPKILFDSFVTMTSFVSNLYPLIHSRLYTTAHKMLVVLIVSVFVINSHDNSLLLSFYFERITLCMIIAIYMFSHFIWANWQSDGDDNCKHDVDNNDDGVVKQ